jgi:hypothetical protein
MPFITLWLAGKELWAICQRSLKRGNEVAVVENPEQRVDDRLIVRVLGFKMGGKRPLRISDCLILGNASACLSRFRTMKRAEPSSIDQGGGKRRGHCSC